MISLQHAATNWQHQAAGLVIVRRPQITLYGKRKNLLPRKVFRADFLNELNDFFKDKEENWRKKTSQHLYKVRNVIMNITYYTTLNL